MRSKNIRKIIFPVILFIFCLLFNTAPAHAQAVDIGIYPPVFQVQTTPPANVKIPFFIQNFQDQSVELNLSIKAFTSSESENGEIVFVDDTSSYPDPYLASRITVLDKDQAVDSLTLSPQQKRELVLEIQIPSNEPKGDYYFSLVFSSNGQTLDNTNSSLASAGVASNILLSVGPLGKNQGLVDTFSSPFFVTKGPLPFTVRLKNTSDHYITPKGNIQIKNMFGQTVGKVDLLPVNILSNTFRRIPDSLQSGTVSDSEYNKIKSAVDKAQFPVAVWPEKFLLGPYTATLTIALSDQGPSYTRQISFFAFPAEYMLGIITLIGLVIFISLRVRKRINAT